MPGLTHWQSPRFFAYFATTGCGARHSGRAPDRRAQPGRDPLAGIARPPGARGGDARLAAAAARLARRRSMVTSRTPPPPACMAALAAARGRAAAAGSSLLRARASVVDKAAASARARREGTRRRAVPADARPARPRRRLRRRRDGRDDVVGCGRPGPCDRRTLRGRGRLAARRRGLRRRRRDLPELRHHFAGWEHADSIGINPHKWLFTPMDCSVLWTRRPRSFAARSASSPSISASATTPSTSASTSIPLGRRFRALKLWAVLRCFGRGRDREPICASTSGSRSCSRAGSRTSRVGSSAHRALLARLLPPRGHRRGERDADAPRQRLRRGVRLAHEARRPPRAAPRDRQLPHDRGRRGLAWDVLRRRS